MSARRPPPPPPLRRNVDWAALAAAEAARGAAVETDRGGARTSNVVRLPRRAPPVFATWDEFLAYHVPKRSGRRAVVVPLRPPPPPPPPGPCRRVSKP